jgi:hypothetical protein
MKNFLLLVLFSSMASAAVIPLDSFDQSKLEHLLRKMPSTLVKTEALDGFTRKHFVFPAKKTGFSIRCSSDFYSKAELPSEKRCEVTISDEAALKGDEYLFKVTDPAVANPLYTALSYGLEEKKYYSNETLRGVAAQDGVFRQIFRYILACKPGSCDLIFSPKENR